MALPKKETNTPMPSPAEFVRDANKKPVTAKGKRVTLYLPLATDDELTQLATENNVSRTVILKALLNGFRNLDINEQNRLIFDAIKNR